MYRVVQGSRFEGVILPPVCLPLARALDGFKILGLAMYDTGFANAKCTYLELL